MFKNIKADKVKIIFNHQVIKSLLNKFPQVEYLKSKRETIIILKNIRNFIMNE
jgi:hypothetical protein